MKKIFFLISIFFFFSYDLSAQDMGNFYKKSRVFSLGLLAGAGQVNLLNTNGKMASYGLTQVGGDIDIRVLGSGPGELHIFVSYLRGFGKNIANTESILGIKTYMSPYFYLSTGFGPHKINLKASSSTTSDMTLTNSIIRVSLGTDFPISDSLYLGGELFYREGMIKKTRNSQLIENSSYDGITFLVKLTWSPPFMDNVFGM